MPSRHLRWGPLLASGAMTLSPMPRIGQNLELWSPPGQHLLSDHDLLTPLHNPIMLLRFESPNGQFRLSVEPNDTFSSLTSKVLGFKPKSAVHRLGHQNANWDRQILGHLPSNTDASTIILSNKPIGHSAGEERLLNSLHGIRMHQVGLS